MSAETPESGFAIAKTFAPALRLRVRLAIAFLLRGANDEHNLWQTQPLMCWITTPVCGPEAEGI
jgi:hypothetical protein